MNGHIEAVSLKSGRYVCDWSRLITCMKQKEIQMKCK